MNIKQKTEVVLLAAFVALVGKASLCWGADQNQNQRPMGRAVMSGIEGELPNEIVHQITGYLDPSVMANLAVAFTDFSPIVAQQARGRRAFFKLLKRKIDEHGGDLEATLIDAINNNWPGAVAIRDYLAKFVDINKVKRLARVERLARRDAVLAGGADRAKLPPEVMKNIAQLLDETSLQRMAQAGAGRAGEDRGFTEIARREKRDRTILAFRLLQRYNGDAQRALFDAIQNNYLGAIDYLIENGANVNASDQNGATALILAARYGREAVVAQLIATGANVNASDQNGSTALMDAARYGHEAIVAQLMQAGADVDAVDRNGDTALMWAATNGHEAIVDQLARANVNAVNRDGNTALIFAAGNGHEAIVFQLLLAGADVNAVNQNGNTALMLAARNGYRAIVARLIAAGADSTNLPTI